MSRAFRHPSSSPSLSWVRDRRDRRAPQVDHRHSHALDLPDLLHLDARLSMDPDRVAELLELSFLGRDAAAGLDNSLSSPPSAPDETWRAELFAEDLFLESLVRRLFGIEIDGLRYPVNVGFLVRTLSSPPTDADAVRFRQDILRELDGDPDMVARCRDLYRNLVIWLDMFRAPDHTAQLDINSHRLDILRRAKTIIDLMADGFAEARSGLRRLHEKGDAFRQGTYYRRLSDLLTFEAHDSTLTVALNIGAGGEIRDLRFVDLDINDANPFHLSWSRRQWLRLKSFLLDHDLNRNTVVQGVLNRVFQELSPALVPLVQVSIHLELYLSALGFRDRLHAAGLETCLAEVAADSPIRLHGLANPLLVDEGPVPCSVSLDGPRRQTLITGPNSGGKTRLLQSLGLAQLLGQSGLFVPARSAALPLLRGMFVSLVETETADQNEGRLGRELLRIRKLFEQAERPSLVILDELCSGTNPTEGTEIVELVLRLLERMGSDAFVSTHFLDFVRRLEAEPTAASLRFLQVEPAPERRSTYQFIDGVAASSLAVQTATRLGVTFEELAHLIDRRLSLPAESPQAELPQAEASDREPEAAPRALQNDTASR